MSSKHVKLNDCIVAIDQIEYIDDSRVEDWIIDVRIRGIPELKRVTGFFAVELVYAVKPSALEGKRMRWRKHAWSVHNLIAHPAMQLLAYIKCYRAGMDIHDKTTPKPVRT